MVPRIAMQAVRGRPAELLWEGVLGRAFELGARASMAMLALTIQVGTANAQSTVSGVEVMGGRTGSLNLKETAATGSRLGLKAIETPASIEILSGDAIRARGDISLANAISRSTGIVQQNDPGNGSTASFAARGFSGVGSVMTLFDGMRLFVGAGTVTFPFDPWTVEQVEVLRGPASVLFGQGALGGAVNIIPKRPKPGMAAYDVQAAYGSNQTYRLALGAGGPISPNLSYRVDVSRNDSQGYVERGGSESLALSGSVRWQPSDTLSFVLSNDYGDQSPMKYFGTPLINGAIDGRTRDLNYNVADARMRFKDNMTQLRTEWSVTDGLRVRNAIYRLTSDREWRNAETYIYDPPGRRIERTDYIPILHDQMQWGDTVDVSVQHDLGTLKNTFVIGAEFNKVQFQHTNDGFPGTTTFLDPFRPDPGNYIIKEASFIPRYRTKTGQYGIFAEDQLKLTDQLSLVGGMRFDSYHVRRLNLLTNVEQVNRTLDNIGYRLGVVYAPNSNTSFYAQYATGSDPLGSLITTSAGQAPFELSTGRQWEAGIKGLFLGGRGEWTVAAYDIVKNKLLTRDRANPTVQVQVGQRSSKGVEASLAVKLGAGWSVEANGTVLDANYDDFTEIVGGVPVSRKGLTPPDTPEKSANIWLSWAFAPNWRVYGGARYVGRQFGDNGNDPRLILPSYTAADAGVEWEVRPNLALNLQLFNALDEIYATSSYGNTQWILARPRAAELRLTGRF